MESASADKVIEASPRMGAHFADRLADNRALLVALGDANRQLVFIELLRHYGGMRVGELVDVVGLSRPAISHHLKLLKDAGVVALYKRERGTSTMRRPTLHYGGAWPSCARMPLSSF